jgi:exportin-2 (importin alpha re-exporter)
LTPDNFFVNNGVLQTAHSIFKKWRYQYRSDDLFREILFVLQKFCPSYLQLFVETDKRLESSLNSGDRDAAATYAQSLLLLSKIFFSLNAQDLPEFFEDNQDIFFPIFLKYMQLQIPLLQSDSNDEPSTFDKLVTVICEIASLYADKYCEDWKYTSKFVEATWVLLTKTSIAPKHDVLVSRAMSLLTTFVRRPAHAQQFKSPDTLRAIMNQIVVPNLKLRESDEELFEDEPVEYFRRDLEGSDSDTRKRAASDLVKGMLELDEVTVTALCIDLIAQMSSSTDFRIKDSSIHLFIAAASRAQITSVGALSSSLDVPGYFQSLLLPELQGKSPSSAPEFILIVDALRFVHAFRRQILFEQGKFLLPLVVAQLSCASFPVRSWASVILDEYLAVAPSEAISQDVLRSIALPLIHILESEFDPLRIQENDVVVKTLHRCIRKGFQDVPLCVQLFIKVVPQVSSNPVNPKFSHYLFESIASVIHMACEASPSAVNEFEVYFFPLFTEILRADVSEFMPYVLQILSQLLNFRPPGSLSPSYEALLPPLLQPTLWESHGNIPALVSLIRAYLSRAALYIVEHNQLSPILGIFQKLVQTRSLDQTSFDLLKAIILYVPHDVLSQYSGAIAQLILARLAAVGARSPKFVDAFISWWAFYLASAPSALSPIQFFEAAQPQISSQLIRHFVIPAMSSPSRLVGKSCRRCVILGWARYATECDAQETIRDLLPCISNFVVASRSDLAKGSGNPNGADALNNELTPGVSAIEDTMYQNKYSKLASVVLPNMDPIPSQQNEYAYFATVCSAIHAKYSAQLTEVWPRIQQQLSEMQ